jgi:hypothetical protein
MIFKSKKPKIIKVEESTKPNPFTFKDIVIQPDGKIIFYYNDGREETLTPEEVFCKDQLLFHPAMAPMVISAILLKHEHEIKNLKESLNVNPR